MPPAIDHMNISSLPSNTPDSTGPEIALIQRFQSVRLFLCDVDGVLTDGKIYVGGSEGMEFKAFHIHDGLGLNLLQQAGIPVGWISARFSPATQRRAQELKIDYLEQGRVGKLALAQSIARRAGVELEQISYMGDDLVDLSLLRHVGLAVAVANARREVLDAAHFVTESSGGNGAVREVVDRILQARGLWDATIKEFLKVHD